MNIKGDDYDGSVGMIHYSDVSVSDTNCLCFPTDYENNSNNIPVPDESVSFSNLICGTLFGGRGGIIYINKDFSNMKRSSFNFASCSKLVKLVVRGKKCKWDSEKETYDYYIVDEDGDGYDDDFQKTDKDTYWGSFTNMIYFSNNFRYITALKKIDLRFPKLITMSGDFYKCTNLTDVTLDVTNLIVGSGAFEGCEKLESITLRGISTFYDKNGKKTIIGKDDDGNVYHEDIKIGIPHLIIGEKMFADCDNLKSFEYPLPSLLFGKNMFLNCKLDADSVHTILKSLPDISKIIKIGNDVDAATIELRDTLKRVTIKDINDNSYYVWTKSDGVWNEKYCDDEGIGGYEKYSTSDNQTNFDKKDTNLICLLKKQKTNGKLQYYFAAKNVGYDYCTDEYIYNLAGHAISATDGSRFGVIDIGVGKNVKTNERVLGAKKHAEELGWTVNLI